MFLLNNLRNGERKLKNDLSLEFAELTVSTPEALNGLLVVKETLQTANSMSNESSYKEIDCEIPEKISPDSDFYFYNNETVTSQ